MDNAAYAIDLAHAAPIPRALWQDASQADIEAYVADIRHALSVYGDDDASRVSVSAELKERGESGRMALVVRVELGYYLTAISGPYCVDQSDPAFVAGMVASWAGRFRNPDRPLFRLKTAS